MIGHNKIQDEVMQAIEQIVNRKLETAGYDKTTTGTITQVLGNNKYKIIVYGHEWTLSSAVDLDLSVGNLAYITMPQGNFNNAYISGIKRK